MTQLLEYQMYLVLITIIQGRKEKMLFQKRAMRTVIYNIP
jgi:hypothetical protein